jgi:hypothetical protein
MPITLENRTRRMQVFSLPHDVFCRAQCACLETTVVLTVENPRTGDRARKSAAKQVPSSMTWLAFERRRGLPSVLLEVPDIKAAIARGELRLLEQSPDPAPAPHAGASSPSRPTPSIAIPSTETPSTKDPT